MMSAATIPSPPESVVCLLHSLLQKQKKDGPSAGADNTASADHAVSCEREVSPANTQLHSSHWRLDSPINSVPKRRRPPADTRQQAATTKRPGSKPLAAEQLAAEYLAKRLKALRRIPEIDGWALGQQLQRQPHGSVMRQGSKEQLLQAVPATLEGSALQALSLQQLAADDNVQHCLKTTGTEGIAPATETAAATAPYGLDSVVQQQLHAEAVLGVPAAAAAAAAVAAAGSDDWLQLWHAGLQDESGDAENITKPVEARGQAALRNEITVVEGGRVLLEGASPAEPYKANVCIQPAAVAAAAQKPDLIHTRCPRDVSQQRLDKLQLSRCHQQDQTTQLVPKVCRQFLGDAHPLAAVNADGGKGSSMAPTIRALNMQQHFTCGPAVAAAAGCHPGWQPVLAGAQPLQAATAGAAVVTARPAVAPPPSPAAAAAEGGGGGGGHRFTLASLLFVVPELPIKQVPDRDCRRQATGRHEPVEGSTAVAAASTISKSGIINKPATVNKASSIPPSTATSRGVGGVPSRPATARQARCGTAQQHQQQTACVPVQQLSAARLHSQAGAAASLDKAVAQNSSDEEGEVADQQPTAVRVDDSVMGLDGAAGDNRKRKKSRGGRQVRQRQQRAEAEQAAAAAVASDGGGQGLYAEIKQWEKENSRARKRPPGPLDAARDLRFSITDKPPCRFWQWSRCSKGDECPYQHSGQPASKLIGCKFHVRGQCRHGSECRFSHEALSKQPCPDLVLYHKCDWGQGQCPFDHGELEPEVAAACKSLLLKLQEDEQQQHAAQQQIPGQRATTPIQPQQLSQQQLGLQQHQVYQRQQTTHCCSSLTRPMAPLSMHQQTGHAHDYNTPAAVLTGVPAPHPVPHMQQQQQWQQPGVLSIPGQIERPW